MKCVRNYKKIPLHVLVHLRDPKCAGSKSYGLVVKV